MCQCPMFYCATVWGLNACVPLNKGQRWMAWVLFSYIELPRRKKKKAPYTSTKDVAARHTLGQPDENQKRTCRQTGGQTDSYRDVRKRSRNMKVEQALLISNLTAYQTQQWTSFCLSYRYKLGVDTKDLQGALEGDHFKHEHGYSMDISCDTSPVIRQQLLLLKATAPRGTFSHWTRFSFNRYRH